MPRAPTCTDAFWAHCFVIIFMLAVQSYVIFTGDCESAFSLSLIPVIRACGHQRLHIPK